MGTRWRGFGRTLPTDFNEHAHSVFATPADIPYDWNYGEVVVDQPNLAAWMLVQCAASSTDTTIETFKVVESSPQVKRGLATPNAAAAGSKTFSVTNSSVAAAAGDFAGGIIQFSAGGGIGDQYRIVDNEAAAGSAALRLTIARPLRAALTTSTIATIFQNPYRHVVEGTASGTNNNRSPLGIHQGADATYTSTARPSFFLQVDGLAQGIMSADLGDAGNDGETLIKAADGALDTQNDTNAKLEVGYIYTYDDAVDVSANAVVPVRITCGPRYILM